MDPNSDPFRNSSWHVCPSYRHLYRLLETDPHHPAFKCRSSVQDPSGYIMTGYNRLRHLWELAYLISAWPADVIPAGDWWIAYPHPSRILFRVCTLYNVRWWRWGSSSQLSLSCENWRRWKMKGQGISCNNSSSSSSHGTCRLVLTSRRSSA